MNCRDCIELLYGFLDGELTVEHADSVQGHLDGCAACFKRSQVEEAFRRTIRNRVGSLAVPPGLEDRIRQALDAEDAGRAGHGGRAASTVATGPWTRRRAWGGLGLAAAAALAAVLVLVPSQGTPVDPLGPAGGPGGALGSPTTAIANPVQVTGRLVCLGCLLMGQPALDPAGRVLLPDPSDRLDDSGLHDRLLFLSDAGGMWELAPTQATGAAVRDHDNRDRAVTLVGTALPQYNTIQVARLSFL